MKIRILRTNFFYISLLIILVSHVNSSAMAGQINAGVFGPIDDFIKVLSREGNNLVSITLSEGTDCVNLFAWGLRHTTSSCITHSFLRSLIINLQSVPVSHPIDLTQFPGAICALFALSLSHLSPVLPDQHMTITRAYASRRNEYLVLRLSGNNNNNDTAHDTELTLIPVISKKGPTTIKVLIRIGDGSQMAFFVQFGSNKRSETLPRKKKGFSGDRDGARSDGSGQPVISRLMRSLSLRRSASSSGATGYSYGTQGTSCFAPFILSYISRYSIVQQPFPVFLL